MTKEELTMIVNRMDSVVKSGVLNDPVMTKDDLNAIKARLEAATPGPWGIGIYNGDYSVWRNISTKDQYEIGGRLSKKDALFFANAPTDIAALIRDAEQLKRDNVRLRKQLKQSQDDWFLSEEENNKLRGIQNGNSEL